MIILRLKDVIFERFWPLPNFIFQLAAPYSYVYIMYIVACLPKPTDNGSREEIRHLAESTPVHSKTAWANKRQIRHQTNQQSITESPLTEDISSSSIVKMINESSINDPDSIDLTRPHCSPLVRLTLSVAGKDT